MSITISGINYDINIQKIDLKGYVLKGIPSEIGNLVNLQELYLNNNKLKILPFEILKIKEKIDVNETSYDINNLSIENEILLFSDLKIKLTNLPINTKEIWLQRGIETKDIKLPFNCVIKYY